MTLLRLCQCGAAVRKPPCPKCRSTTNHRKRNRPSWTGVYNTARWKNLRRYVLARDDYTCSDCGRHAESAGHVEPFTGPDDPLAWDESNIRAQCLACNGREAGHRTPRTRGSR